MQNPKRGSSQDKWRLRINETIPLLATANIAKVEKHMYKLDVAKDPFQWKADFSQTGMNVLGLCCARLYVSCPEHECMASSEMCLLNETL